MAQRQNRGPCKCAKVPEIRTVSRQALISRFQSHIFKRQCTGCPQHTGKQVWAGHRPGRILYKNVYATIPYSPCLCKTTAAGWRTGVVFITFPVYFIAGAPLPSGFIKKQPGKIKDKKLFYIEIVFYLCSVNAKDVFKNL